MGVVPLTFVLDNEYNEVVSTCLTNDRDNKRLGKDVVCFGFRCSHTQTIW